MSDVRQTIPRIALREPVTGLPNRAAREALAAAVEDEPTWRALAREGCDTVQGYYVERPLPVEDSEAWATASRFRPASTRIR